MKSIKKLSKTVLLALLTVDFSVSVLEAMRATEPQPQGTKLNIEQSLRFTEFIVLNTEQVRLIRSIVEHNGETIETINLISNWEIISPELENQILHGVETMSAPYVEPLVRAEEEAASLAEARRLQEEEETRETTRVAEEAESAELAERLEEEEANRLAAEAFQAEFAQAEGFENTLDYAEDLEHQNQ